MFDPDDLASELRDALANGEFVQYLKRATGESKLYQFGNACGWDRESMINYCLKGISGWLGREVFEKSFDNGSMKGMAEIYHKALIEYKTRLLK